MRMTKIEFGQETDFQLELLDDQWPDRGSDHDRLIARAIAVDSEGCYWFVRVQRNDEFGNCTLIETSGGGVEEGEEPYIAVIRELREELGAEAEVICPIGVVSDYYNLIRRHNINRYYLCRIRSFTDPSRTRDEIDQFHLSNLRMTYEDAVREYERCSVSRLGKLIAARELPVLMKANEILRSIGNQENNR